MQMTEKERITLEKFGKFTQESNTSNDFLVELIQQAGSFLNLRTIPNYAKQEGMSYEGVRKFRNVTEIFNVKFVIDNE